MQSESVILVDCCKRALAGEQFRSSEFVRTLSDPSKLNQTEKAAWINLRYWDDEVEKQAGHPAVVEATRSRLQTLLKSLTAS